MSVAERGFEAAHRLPQVPADHKCFRLHGHSYRLRVEALSDSSELGNGIDRVVRVLDHRYLNELDGLENPTAENLAVWIWDRLLDVKPVLVRVDETCESGCVYRGPNAG